MSESRNQNPPTQPCSTSLPNGGVGNAHHSAPPRLKENKESLSTSSTLQVPPVRRISSAHTKRCRFALKENSNGGTNSGSPPLPPSSPGPSSKGERKSRSPGPKPRNLLKAAKHGPETHNKVKCPLSLEEAEELILTAATGRNLPSGVSLLGSPPNRPQGGVIYLHRSATGKQEWREDGYQWAEILFQDSLPTTRGNTLDYRHFYVRVPLNKSMTPDVIESVPNLKTSSRFRRETYGMGYLTLVSYIGDFSEAERDVVSKPLAVTTAEGSVSKGYPLQNQSGLNCFVTTTSSAYVSSLVGSATNKIPTVQPPNHPYQHHLSLPYRITPSPYNVPSACEQYQGLGLLAEELASGKFVKNLTIFPSLQVTLIHPDMTKQFEHCCKLMYVDRRHQTDIAVDVGLKLFYDITFPIGSVYATILTFANCCFEGNPVMPLAVNIHERKFKSSHQLFWARVLGDIPALQKYRFPLLIDDAEPAVHLAVRSQAPNLVQLEGWTHRFRDIETHMRKRGYGEEAVSYYKACISYLLQADSKQAMHDRYRREFEGIWPKDFVQYYRERLLPRSGRLGRWAMSMANISEPHYLSSHVNPQERFHILCRHFSGWESLRVDQLMRAFYLLFSFHIAESHSNGGLFVLKKAFRPLFLDYLRDRPRYTRPPDPADIVAFVKQNYAGHFPSKPDIWKLWDGSSTEVIAGYELLPEDPSSITITNRVPSPAPNGRVPSPAPAGFPSTSSSFHPPIPARHHAHHQHPFVGADEILAASLSTIPEISLEKHHQLSMDSSVVTEGHYDASFESENDHYIDNPDEACNPRAPPPPAPETGCDLLPHQAKLDVISSTTSAQFHIPLTSTSSKNTSSKTATTTSPPTTVTQANSSIAVSTSTSISSQPDAGAKPIPSSSSSAKPAANNPTIVPSSLMLWKKVQHCVVFGGSFVPKRLDV